MSGLLLKELLLLKSGWKSYTFLVLFYAVFAFNGSVLLLPMLLLLIPVSSFSSDELARWDGFAAALPGGRRAVVRVKYQYLFLIMAAVLVLSCLFGLLGYLLRREPGESLVQLLVTALVCTAVFLLINCILYPPLFKYGSQKARLLMGAVFGVVFAGFAVGALLSFGGGMSFEQLDELSLTVSPVVPAVAVVLLILTVVISYHISCRIYDKKEF